ncbi:MAG: Maf family protein, partial [Gaiellaceae bacterium]
EVLTGIALVRAETSAIKVAHEVTKVRFATMTAEEIEWYLTTGEAIDKAGAYAIQGRAARFIEGIEGDYLNVVGLPAALLVRLLAERFSGVYGFG